MHDDRSRGSDISHYFQMLSVLFPLVVFVVKIQGGTTYHDRTRILSHLYDSIISDVNSHVPIF